MKKSSKKKKNGATESSGVPSSTPVGLRGQVKVAGQPHTAGGTPEWKGGKVPRGIAVPPKKLT